MRGWEGQGATAAFQNTELATGQPKTNKGTKGDFPSTQRDFYTIKGCCSHQGVLAGNIPPEGPETHLKAPNHGPAWAGQQQPPLLGTDTVVPHVPSSHGTRERKQLCSNILFLLLLLHSFCLVLVVFSVSFYDHSRFFFFLNTQLFFQERQTPSRTSHPLFFFFFFIFFFFKASPESSQQPGSTAQLGFQSSSSLPSRAGRGGAARAL